MNEIIGTFGVLPSAVFGGFIAFQAIVWREIRAERAERRDDVNRLRNDFAKQREEDRAEDRRQREEDRAEDRRQREEDRAALAKQREEDRAEYRRQREEDRANLREWFELHFNEVLRRLDAGGKPAGEFSNASSGSAAPGTSLAASPGSSSDSRS